MKSSKHIPYTKTSGPKEGCGHKSGTVLGPYATQAPLNRKKGHRNNGGSVSPGKGKGGHTSL